MSTKCAFCLQTFDRDTAPTACPHCGMPHDLQPAAAVKSFREVTLEAIQRHAWDYDGGSNVEGRVTNLLSCRSCGAKHSITYANAAELGAMLSDVNGSALTALKHNDGCAFAAALAWAERSL